METSSAEKKQKLAIVQFDKLLKQLPLTKAVYADIEKMSNSYQATLAAMAKEGQEKYEKLQSQANAVNSPIRKIMEEEIVSIQQRIQTMQASCEQELQKKQGELAPIAENLVKTIKSYGEKNNYSAIFYDSAVVYSGDLVDITEALEQELKLHKEIVKPTVQTKPSSPSSAKK